MSVLSLVPDDKKKDTRKESLESVYSSNSRLNLLNKRKRLNPLEMSQTPSVKGDRYVTQRVLSAKAHRVKQLQNQLADAHYHLQELSNENRVLRAMQKKQDIALQRYENSNAELPTVLHSHNEEMRIQQSKYKQLKQQYKEATQKLKERDMQLQQLRDEHQHLLELSKDRNLLDREKLQAQVTDLSARVQQQNETIAMLQRRIVLEAKNFRHQLQHEINKHKDTRHDLDLAISNADKLSTIIEMKEKMINSTACRTLKSPTKSSISSNRPVSRSKSGHEGLKHDDRSDRANVSRNLEDRFSHYNFNEVRTAVEDSSEDSSFSVSLLYRQVDQIAKLCENSRNLQSVLSHDEETSSSAEPRSRYARSRASSTSTRSTPNQTRKSSKGSDDISELAKTVQEGMADLTIFDEIDLENPTPEEMQKKIDIMKADLLNKIKHDDPLSRKGSSVRRQSTEESIEEQIDDEVLERPKSRGRRGSNVSFYDNVNIEETTTIVSINDYRDRQGGGGEGDTKLKRENSALEKRIAGKPMEKYCKDIIHDIEKSSKVIDKHIKHFNNSKFEGDKIVESLHAVDKINEYVNLNGEIPEETLAELNNNFKMLTEQVFTEAPATRKRAIADRKGSKESKTSLLGDDTMTNQDLLNDLLGRK